MTFGNVPGVASRFVSPVNPAKIPMYPLGIEYPAVVALIAVRAFAERDAVKSNASDFLHICCDFVEPLAMLHPSLCGFRSRDPGYLCENRLDRFRGSTAIVRDRECASARCPFQIHRR